MLLDSNFSYHATPGEQYYPADFSVRRIMPSLRYQLEKWEFSSELQQERTKIDGFFAMPFQQDTIGQGAYLLAQYRQSPRLKWFAMLDYSVINKDDRRGRQLSANSGDVVPAYFGYQQSVAAGLSLDLTATLRLSAEAHFVEGTGRLAPVILPDLVANQHKYWQLYAIQLMYRF